MFSVYFECDVSVSILKILCLFFTDNFRSGSNVISFGYPINRFFVSEQISNIYCILFWWIPIYIPPISIYFIVEDNPWSFVFPIVS